MKQAIVEVIKKELLRNEVIYEIVRFENIKEKKELPKEYFSKEGDYFFLANKNRIITYNSQNEIGIRYNQYTIGNRLNTEQWENLKNFLKGLEKN